jgi:RNA polymerase sigma-70 factor (ECF subfamily)
MIARRSHAPLSLVVGQNPQAASDGDVARGMMEGDAWAIAEVWRRFAPMVLTMAKRTLGSQSEAEDLGQEVFYRLFRKAKLLREPDSLRSFVYAFTIRALRTELRRKKLREWLRFDKPEVLAFLGSRSLDIESRDLLRKFHGLLERLTARERLVFILKRMESMTVEEIAASMEISESTVKRTMAHASSRLLRWIGADPGLASLLDGERWGE